MPLDIYSSIVFDMMGWCHVSCQVGLKCLRDESITQLYTTCRGDSKIPMNVFCHFFRVGEVEDNSVSFPSAPEKFPGWVLYRGLFEVGLIVVFAEEGPKKGVGLINGGFHLGLQAGGTE